MLAPFSRGHVGRAAWTERPPLWWWWKISRCVTGSRLGCQSNVRPGAIPSPVIGCLEQTLSPSLIELPDETLV